MRAIVPPRSASISFMIFMASMMHTGSPAFTVLPTSTNALAPGLAER
jgi:hypothetical protein